MLAEIFSFKKLLPLLVFAGLLLALYFNFKEWGQSISYFNDMFRFDNYSILFSTLIIEIGIIWFLISQGFFKNETSLTDHYAVMLFAIVGGVTMTGFTNLMLLFVGLETLSISMYVMAASNKGNVLSNEAGLKYFLLGSFATGFILFGMALIYGVCGSFNLTAIANFVTENSTNLPAAFYAGLILLTSGLLFKVSAVPFHFWTPDVYEGSPTQVTAFMATIVKAAAFAGFFRLFYICFGTIITSWVEILMAIAALTMIIGNVLAVSQHSFKRMLAYSGIAHAGYMLMAIVACNTMGARGLLIYTYAYAAASLGAFAFLYVMSDQLKNENIDSMQGLGNRNPLLGIFLSIILLSLAGIPPLAGFFGKYYIFYAVMEQGHIGLVILAVVNSLIGVYYYLRPVFTMFQPTKDESPVMLPPFTLFFMGLIVLMIFIIGFAPQLIFDLL